MISLSELQERLLNDLRNACSRKNMDHRIISTFEPADDNGLYFHIQPAIETRVAPQEVFDEIGRNLDYEVAKSNTVSRLYEISTPIPPPHGVGLLIYARAIAEDAV